MRDEKSLVTAKKATKTASSDACRVSGVNFKISVGDYGGKTKYISTGNLFKARFIRRISAVSNAIRTIDNEMICFIIYCLNCIRHGRNATYERGLRSLNGVDKIRLAILLKIHRGDEMDPRNGKSSRERETASFCSRFNIDPPRLEAEGRLKSNSLQEILPKSMPFWAEPQSDVCHFLSLKLSSICCALMNSIVPRPIRCCRCWSN